MVPAVFVGTFFYPILQQQISPNITVFVDFNLKSLTCWNSTIVSIDGNIDQGETIKLIATLAPERVFKLAIKAFEPEQRMVWGDFQGNREFTLSKNNNGDLEFRMSEKIGGILFPLFAGFIPSFDEAFEQFAADLKKEAESIQQQKSA